MLNTAASRLMNEMQGRSEWDAQSVFRLADLRAEGRTISEIAAALGRTEAGVAIKIRRLIEVGFLRSKGPEGKSMRHCICCRKQFASPDRKRVQICQTCKTSETFRAGL